MRRNPAPSKGLAAAGGRAGGARVGPTDRLRQPSRCHKDSQILCRKAPVHGGCNHYRHTVERDRSLLAASRQRCARAAGAAAGARPRADAPERQGGRAEVQSPGSGRERATARRRAFARRRPRAGPAERQPRPRGAGSAPESTVRWTKDVLTADDINDAAVDFSLPVETANCDRPNELTQTSAVLCDNAVYSDPIFQVVLRLFTLTGGTLQVRHRQQRTRQDLLPVARPRRVRPQCQRAQLGVVQARDGAPRARPCWTA